MPFSIAFFSHKDVKYHLSSHYRVKWTPGQILVNTRQIFHEIIHKLYGLMTMAY
jgi:hypothetical protein